MARSAFSRILVALSLTLAFALSFHKIRDMDVGFHLKAGEEILATGRVPAKDTFTYTVNDNDYVDIYWFYQVCLALENAAMGPFGIVFTHAFLTAFAFWLAWRRFGFSGHTASAAGPPVLLAGVLAASYHYSVRPHVFSWVLLNLALLTLERYRRDRKAPLWPLPVIMLVWANSHTLYPLAWIAMGCHFVGSWRTDGKPDRKLFAVAALCVAVCFINPYGWKGVWLPFQQFGFLQQGDLFKQYITEYRSPFSSDWLLHYRAGGHGEWVILQPVFFFHVFAALSAVAFLARLIRRRFEIGEFLIAVFFSYVMAIALKNVGVFVFAVLPLVKDGMTDLWEGIARRSGRIKPPWSAAAIPQAALSLFALALLMRVLTNAYYVSWNSRDETGYEYNLNNVPLRAAQFLTERKLEGRILNHLNFGGFLAYFLPQRVFIDGRNEVIGQKFFRHYQMMSSPQGIGNMLNEFAPDIVLFPHRSSPSWHLYFAKRKDWRLAYADDVAAVYLRRGYADEVPALTEDDALKNFPLPDAAGIDALLNGKKPDTLLQGFYRKQSAADVETGFLNFYIRNGWYRAGLRAGLAALATSTRPGPGLYFNLGQGFRLTGDNVRARACYLRYVEEFPDPNVLAFIAKVDAMLSNSSQRR